MKNLIKFPESEQADAVMALVSDMQKTIPNLVLAGGYLRDLYFNKKPNDLDFYFRHGDEKLNLAYIFDVLFPKRHNYTFVSSSHEYVNAGMMVYNFQSDLNKTKAQLIYHPEQIEKVIMSFDYSFNQIWYNGKDLYATEAFMKTAETKVVTQIGKLFGSGTKNYARLEIFKRKFDDFNFDSIKLAPPKAKGKGIASSMSVEQIQAAIINQTVFNTPPNFGPLFQQAPVEQGQAAAFNGATITTTTTQV